MRTPVWGPCVPAYVWADCHVHACRRELEEKQAKQFPWSESRVLILLLNENFFELLLELLLLFVLLELRLNLGHVHPVLARIYRDARRAVEAQLRLRHLEARRANLRLGRIAVLVEPELLSVCCLAVRRLAAVPGHVQRVAVAGSCAIACHVVQAGQQLHLVVVAADIFVAAQDIHVQNLVHLLLEFMYLLHFARLNGTPLVFLRAFCVGSVR